VYLTTIFPESNVIAVAPPVADLEGVPTMRKLILLVAVILAFSTTGFAQGDGKLQIHFMDVGQGDGAVLISPQGEVVLFDDGVKNNCTKPVSYLQGLGVTKIAYHIASHYHADHIGCAKEVFSKFPLEKAAIDRGGSYNSTTYTDYVTATGTKRRTAVEGETITLDAGTANPVLIRIIALNGNGVSTTNENDLSVVAMVKFGNFKAEIGGDLSGFATNRYEDIETSVAPKIGQVEVYKVHHHCSQYSTNTTWIQTIQPKVAVVSVGDGNDYGHPTRECIEQLHNAGVKLYWTERGAGEPPDSSVDVIAGNVVVQVLAGAPSFTVAHGTVTDTFPLWDSSGVPLPSTLRYAWSKRSGIYHFAECKVVTTIKPENLQRGDTPPQGKTLHQLCPQQ